MQKIKSPVFIILVICLLAVITVIIVFLNSKSTGNKNGELSKTLEDNNIRVEEGGGAQKTADLPAMSTDDHLWGDLQNPVKMIIYSDFECPFCLEFSNSVKKVMENYQGKVAIAFRHRPLIFHTMALAAAQASECAAEQGKFWEMHDKLYEDAGENNLTADEFKKDAGELALDQEKFNQCVLSGNYKEKIINQSKIGEKAGAGGTPTFFVGNEIYPGAYPYEDFVGREGKTEEGLKSIIERHLKK